MENGRRRLVVPLGLRDVQLDWAADSIWIEEPPTFTLDTAGT